jgi:hypothetical protein
MIKVKVPGFRTIPALFPPHFLPRAFYNHLRINHLQFSHSPHGAILLWPASRLRHCAAKNETSPEPEPSRRPSSTPKPPDSSTLLSPFYFLLSAFSFPFSAFCFSPFYFLPSAFSLWTFVSFVSLVLPLDSWTG